ncbi:MAG TPA: hypothetical protein VMV24_01205 [Candidatus Dormibacteraeota bacterium]|nr:hypothetical protein [Candidatus Dormibacteraeota bacterium]
MTSRQEAPDILILSSLNPIERNGKLISPKLNDRVLEYEPFVPYMWSEFLETETGSLEAESKARKLSEFYLLKIALQLQNMPVDTELLIERFNQASIELYGRTDPVEAASIANTELIELNNNLTDDSVIAIYKKIANNKNEKNESLDSSVFDELRSAFFEKFSGIVDIIQRLPDGPYSPEAIRKIFEDILGDLSIKEKSWLEWNITNSLDNTMLNVVPEMKEIDVPDGRQDVEDKRKLLGLVFHEIIIHAQRAVNGYELNDELMYRGLPTYLDFEEGLGVMSEYLVTGVIPDKIRDRYIDIALATGVVDGFLLGRQELIEFGIKREKARALTRGKTLNIEDTHKMVNDHVNRIFRGGTGEAIRDENGKIVLQAVFTKDIVYYTGFISARNYIKHQLLLGTPSNKLINFLLSGKFDPTNSSHLEYLKNKHSIKL